MKIHTIHFSGHINTASLGNLQAVVNQALAKGAKKLRMYMASQGGSTSAGFAMYGFLSTLPIDLSIINIGNVESMACLVFLAGKHRYALPTSRFLFHSMTWEYAENTFVSYSKMKEQIATLDNDINRYVEVFESDTKQAKERLNIRECLTIGDAVVTPQDAVKYGIVDEVTVHTIPDVGENRWWVTSQ